MAEELRPHGVTALAITPGFLRSEMMLDHFGVTEANWRDGAKKDPNFIASETPCFRRTRDRGARRRSTGYREVGRPLQLVAPRARIRLHRPRRDAAGHRFADRLRRALRPVGKDAPPVGDCAAAAAGRPATTSRQRGARTAAARVRAAARCDT